MNLFWLVRKGMIALLALGPMLGWAGWSFPDGAIQGFVATMPESSPARGTYYATNGLGDWIWTTTTRDRQTCQFWRQIEIPAGSPVVCARLVMTADNEFMLHVDGAELGRGDEWRELFAYDIAPMLTPGIHTLGVKAYNSSSFAGMLFGLRIEFQDGKVMEIKSDSSWSIVPEGARNWLTRTTPARDWEPATVVGEFGSSPWASTPEKVNIAPIPEPVKSGFWQAGWFQITLLSVCGMVILLSFRLMAQLALHQKERLLLQLERERIARDIHDDLGSRMTQLVLHGEVAMSELAPTSPTRPQLDRICDESREMLSRMDEILWAVNPQCDTLRDFTSYVCGYIQEFLKPTEIQALFEIDPEMATAALDLPLRRSLLMAIKETLNNTVKHSGATELRLAIRARNHRLTVMIEDNGRGFDPTASKVRGNGLVNLVARMSEFGGSCFITSQPGKGCRVAFDIPMPDLRRNRWGWIWDANQFSRKFGWRRGSPQGQAASLNRATQC